MKWSLIGFWLFSLFLLVLVVSIVRAVNRVTLDASTQAEPPSKTGPIFTLAGLFLTILGAKLHLIHSFAARVPYMDEWGCVGSLFPLLDKNMLQPTDLFSPSNEARIVFQRVISLNIVSLNGQWDPIVEMTVNAILHSSMLTFTCVILWRLSGRRHLAVFCATVAAIGVLPFAWENTLWSFSLSWYFLVGFSIAGIILLTSSKSSYLYWCLGFAAIICAQLNLASGFLTALAVLGTLTLCLLSKTLDHKKFLLLSTASLAVACIGYALMAGCPPHHEPLKSRDLLTFLEGFAVFASWPFPYWPTFLMFWAPLAILVWRHFRGGMQLGTIECCLLTMGMWMLLQAMAFGFARGGIRLGGTVPIMSRYTDLLAIGPVVYISALTLILEGTKEKTERSLETFIAVPLLIAIVAISAFQIGETYNYLRSRPTVEMETNTADYVLTGDPSFLSSKAIPHPRPERLMTWLANPVLREFLPACIREPIDLGRAKGSGFGSNMLPPSIQSHRKVTGSWRPDGGEDAALFESQAVKSRRRWLELEIAGGGPGISMELLPISGKSPVRVPVEKVANNWTQVRIRAPEGSFKVLVKDESRTNWIAFTWPRELASGGYYAARFCSTGLFLELIGLIILLWGIFLRFRDSMATVRSKRPSGPGASPSRGSHGSGLAQLTAPRVMVS